METIPSFRRFRSREWLSADPDTVGYNFVSDSATTGWRNCSRDYSRQYDGRIRFALVGLGGFTREWIIPSVAESPYAETTCLVSGDPEKADRIADEHGIDQAVTYDAFLDGAAEESYDAVYIATPNALHLPYAEHAAEAAKHVLCEKPMEATADRARRMVEACEAAGVTLMIAYTGRQNY